MTTKRTRFGMLGVCTLSLALALVGCGAKEATIDTDAQETTVEEEVIETPEVSETQSITIPDGIGEVGAITKDLVSGAETPDATGFGELPTREDAQLQVFEPSDIDTGLDSADKAPTGSILLTDGGIQMQIPASWMVGQDEDGFVLQDINGYMLGFMFSEPKQAGAYYDIEAIIQSVPTACLRSGYTNVQLLSYDTYYSTSGKLCGAAICYSATLNGIDFFFYNELIESKSYLNSVQFGGIYDEFAYVSNEVAAAVDSIAFNVGEEI